MKSPRFFVSLFISVVLLLVSSTVAAAESTGCAEGWTYSNSLEFAPGFWEVGPHAYDFHLVSPGGEANFHREFQSTMDAPLYKFQVQLHFSGLQPGSLSEINPEQDTVLQLTTGFSSKADAAATRAATVFQARWDGGEWVDLPAGPITKSCVFNNGSLKRTWGPIFR
jgi:hypothetical protein